MANQYLKIPRGFVSKKYRNKPTNGYASKREAKRGAELEALQAAGKIYNLRKQVKYELVPKQLGERSVTYVADFEYGEDGIHTVVEDVKGFKTPEYVIKRKLMLHVHGIKIKEI
jgi:hypothetical protein